MMFGKTRTELKVGTFVFIGLVILGIGVLMIGKFRTWTSGYAIDIRFNFVNGVKSGAPVRFAGVDVGEVKDLNIIFVPNEGHSKVKIVAWIKNGVKIPVDSTVWVNTLGLLGEKYIEIIPGNDTRNFVQKNNMLVGTDPLAMNEVTVMAKKIVGDLNDIIVQVKNGQGTVGRLFYDDTMYKELSGAIKSKEGTIGRFLYDDSIYKEVEALIADLRRNPWKLFWKIKEQPAKK